MRASLPNYPRLVARGARWCIAHTWACLGLTFALLIAAGALTAQISVDQSPEAFLERSHAWAEYAEIDQDYGIGETIIVAFRETGGTVFDAETVTAVRELDRRLAELDGVKRVLSVASASVLGSPGEADDTLDLGPLLAPGPVDEAGAARLGARVMAHPIYARVLQAKRVDRTFLLIQVDSELADPGRRIQIVGEIRELADRFATSARQVHLAGASVTKEAVAAGVSHDILTFFPAATVLLLILLWIIFGDPLSALVPITVIGLASIFVLASMSLFGVHLNMATAMVPTIILVVGVADGVHFLCELRRQYARNQNREAALIGTVEVVALPCLLTSATSAAGFAALLSSTVGPLSQLGLSAAVGLMLAYALSMFLTPVLLAAFGYPKGPPKTFGAAEQLGRAVGALAAVAARRTPYVLGAVGLMIGACVAALGHMQINSDIIGYFGEDHRLRRDRAVIDEALGGANSIELILDAGEDGGFLEPSRLAVVDRLAKGLREQHGYQGVFGYSDYLRFAYEVLAPEAPEGALPDSREAVAQLLLLSPSGFSALASDDRRRVRMMVAVPALSSEATLAYASRLEGEVDRYLEGTGVEAKVTGMPMMFARLVRTMMGDAASSFALAAIAIWLALMLGLRSAPLGTLAMIPNLLPVGLTFTTMIFAGMSFDTNSAFVACIGAGIAVDDTVHIIARYQRARNHGAPTPMRALVYAMTQAGHPVLLTSVLLGVGYSVLCLSSFQPTMQIGLLITLLVVYALAFDLLVLPVLLMAADRFVERQAGPPAPTASGTFEHLTKPPGALPPRGRRGRRQPPPTPPPTDLASEVVSPARP